MTTLISFDVLAKNVYEDLNAYGGATVSAIVGVPTVTSGYGVSLPGHEHRVPLRVGWLGIREDIAAYAERKRSELAVPGRYLGAWIDDGIVYLDVTEVHAERATAERLGYERNQLAIWDFARSEEIRMVQPFTVESSAIAELGEDGELRIVPDVRGCSCGMADYGAPGHDGDPLMPIGGHAAADEYNARRSG